MHNNSTYKLRKANTKENKSGLLAKIHEADQFEQLRNCCMVFWAILTGQPIDADSLQVQLRSASG